MNQPNHLVSLMLFLLGACSRPETRSQETASATTPPPPETEIEKVKGEEASPPPREKKAMDDRADEREALVRETVEARGVKDPRVIAAMRRVPRHAFVVPAFQLEAYTDRPLPIVGGQTISQPYIVAFMTEAALPTATSKCLEIGTGSGYQAAVLAEVCREVYSIEYLPDVAEFGERNLRALGYGADRVRLRTGDGYRGWPEAAPFDVILVTAAPDRVPKPLLDQLAVGGRMVIPVGDTEDIQVLMRYTRRAAGAGPEAFSKEELMGVRFVPFLGNGAAAE